MKQSHVFCLVALLAPAAAQSVPSVKDRLAQGGVIVLHQELRITATDHDWDIDAHHTTLQLAPDFHGRAALVITAAHNIRIRGLTIDGNREHIAHAEQELAPANTPYAVFTGANGVLMEKSGNVHLENLTAKEISGFAVLVTASDHVQITGAQISNSGSRDAFHRNNATGGILLEEGTHDFEVTHCDLRDLFGNGIWTRSLAKSPRNADGRITENKISGIGRNAIQIGSATRVLVEKNAGAKVGYPLNAVASGGDLTPIAIATAGDTDAAQYRENAFEEVNGTCIGLDGFHDGEVRGNSCVNAYDRNAYPNSHFGIVMNNSDPRMQSRNVLIWGNRLEGFLYGGLVIIGSGHRVSHNHFLQLNLAHCNEERVETTCRYAAGEPDLLRSGIYLRNKAARAAATRDNIVEDNEISGFGMGAKCVAVGPGVDAAQNRIGHNDCADDTPVSASLQPLPITRPIAFTSLRTGGSSNTGNTSTSPSRQLE